MTEDIFNTAKKTRKNKTTTNKKEMAKLTDAILAFTASAQAIHDRIENLEKHMAYLLSKDPSWVAAYEKQQDNTTAPNG